MQEDGTHTDGLREGKDVYDDSGRYDAVFRNALEVIQRYSSTIESNPTVDYSRLESLQICRDLLKRYTKRTLTLSTDRLPAISGVAMRFSRILADQYCAGLWKSTLCTELLWAV